ncbi:MAG: ATP-binding protein, partial [Leptothrix sp. (in: b-proteobacteria)]
HASGEPDNRGMSSLATPPNPALERRPDPLARVVAPVPGLSLRARIQLLLGALMALFIAALLAQQIEATRNGVHEEIVAGNRVAGQLLQRVGFLYRLSGPGALLDFLNQLGRVRANEITLTDPTGAVLYRSPPSAYKQGRAAPDWFADWVAPAPQRQLIELPSGQLVVEADPSRAILDGWDDLCHAALAGGLTLLLLNLVVFWSVGRTLRPFSTILRGLARLEAGDYAARLPTLPGSEAASIGVAVNRMAAAVEGQLQARLAAYEAQRSLAESREIARQIEHHTERERREMARELHDELGQSVTAIRSLANSLVHRLGERDAEGTQVAALISSEAARLYEAMHGLIPRLTPMALDSLGLADALADLVSGARQRPGAPQITLQVPALPASIDGLADGDLALAAYRVAQEALNNALRHSQATAIAVDVRLLGDAGAGDARLQVTVEDNGVGLPGDWQRPGHYGLRGLRERVRGLGGELLIEPVAAPQTGVRVLAEWPLAATTPPTATERRS